MSTPGTHTFDVDESVAQPLLHYQAALESVVDFTAASPLSPTERTQATSVFTKILDYYESYKLPPHVPEKSYDRGKLLRLVHEYVLSEQGRDKVLKYFLVALASPDPEQSLEPSHDFSYVLTHLAGFEEKSKEEKDQIALRVQELGDHLVTHFFLPFKGSSLKTPQLTPRFSVPLEQDNALLGTPERLSTLRGRCLTRDRHRCVISGLFDRREALRRIKINRENARDDDGLLLVGEDLDTLEVAHIIPHALGTSDNISNTLDGSKAYALQILNMFDPGILHWIEGTGIDRPTNALTLTSNLHDAFGELVIYFEAEPGFQNRYTIKTIEPLLQFRPVLPVTRDLCLSSDYTIDPPMARLLAIHRACCLIMHLSGAGDYVDKVLRDMEEIGVKSDGTTELGNILSLRFWQTGEQSRLFEGVPSSPHVLS